MKDGPVRRAIKRTARLCFDVSTRVQRARLRRRGIRPFALGGDCQRCAGCCEAPGIQVGWLTFHWPALRRAFLLWQERVNGFVFVQRRARECVLVFRCTHFDPETRSCDSYGSRPGLCRDYPRNLMWQPNPELLPGCGYRPVAANADALLRALAGTSSLSPERMARLRKNLFLDR